MAAQSGALSAALRSAAWLGSEKLLRVLLALFVGVWVARYLGPEDYGKLSLALSWVGLLGSMAWLGVGDAMTRELVREPTEEGRLLGSALLLRFSGCLLALACIGAALAAGLIPADLSKLVLILCLMLPAAELTGGIWMWFQARVRMGRVVMAKNASLIVGATLRVVVISATGSVEAIAWTFVVEAAVVGLGVLLVYRLEGQGLAHWRFDPRHAWCMFLTGLPLLLSAMVTSLNARIDQLMLGWLADTREVGIYAAAARLSEIWWVVPTLIMQSVAPRFLFATGLKEARLQRNGSWLLWVLLALATLPCLVLTAASKPVIAGLLGAQYSEAAVVLTVHVWMAVFVFVDAVQSQILLARGQQRALVHKSLGALAVNAVAAWFLILPLGAVGAALAALVAQIWTALLFYYVHAGHAPMRQIQKRAWRNARRSPRAAGWWMRRRSRTPDH